MTRERIFLDTWFILALLNARDADYAEAKRLLPRIRSAETLVTTDAILLEACNGLAKYNRAGAAQRSLEPWIRDAGRIRLQPR